MNATRLPLPLLCGAAMFLLAPLLGKLAYILFPENAIAAAYFIMAAVSWPFAWLLWTIYRGDTP